MICRLAGGNDLKVFSFAAFVELCGKLYEKENHNLPDSALTYGCRRCETGQEIKSGRLKDLPSNVEMLTIEKVTAMSKLQKPKKILIPKSLNPRILSLSTLSRMTPSDLKNYWTVPIPKSKSQGRCVNCRRDKLINALGMCHQCYDASYQQTGTEMLQALYLAAQAPPISDTVAEPITDGVQCGLNIVHDQETATDIEPGQPGVEEINQPDLSSVIANLKEIIATYENTLQTCRRLLGWDERDQDTIIEFIVNVRMDELAMLRNLSDKLRHESSHEGNILVLPGYEPLFAILVQALDQAQNGKGSERHANGLPFLRQPIMTETRCMGLGFPSGQARKKILEAKNCAQAQPQRAIADLLGAINYTAATIIGIQEMHGGANA